MDYKRIRYEGKELVSEYYTKNFPNEKVLPEDVYEVWYCKTLDHAKMLLSTDVPDGRYFEVTYNGIKNEIYFDVYVKESDTKVEL